jgi:hypothetical protein
MPERTYEKCDSDRDTAADPQAGAVPQALSGRFELDGAAHSVPVKAGTFALHLPPCMISSSPRWWTLTRTMNGDERTAGRTTTSASPIYNTIN